MQKRFDNFTTLITQIYKNLGRIKNLEMAELNLRGTHVMCLYYLGIYEEGLTLTKLSGLCEEDKAATSRIVVELTERGYITTLSDKKYRAPIVLTESGKEVSLRINDMIDRAVIAGGAGLTREEREAFYKALALVSDNLNHYITKNRVLALEKEKENE